MEYIKKLLQKMIEISATDLHLRVGRPPFFRLHSKLVPIKGDPITVSQMDEIVAYLLGEDKYKEFIKNKEIDLGIGISKIGRFRINCYFQRGTMAVAIRRIMTTVPDFESLNLPPVIKEIAMAPRGLILVTGTTGSGKSTTLAAMIDYVNQNASKNIITIEDPIEYLHKDKKSLISQREVGTDTESYYTALKQALRQDPDVILIGEIRDRETMLLALQAADTGHLVMSTLHTLNAVETISRIISFFPPHQHDQIRLLLSGTLVAVISQRLLPRADKQGIIPAVEILRSTATIKEYILDPEKTPLIEQVIEEGRMQYQTQSFDQHILELVKSGKISIETALDNVNNPEDFKLKLEGIEDTSSRKW